ncbi:hypothetical protein BCR44DRAFT_41482, partial [Catenaria anguillulae PL171]
YYHLLCPFVGSRDPCHMHTWRITRSHRPPKIDSHCSAVPVLPEHTCASPPPPST